MKILTHTMVVCIVSILCGCGTTLQDGANSNTSQFERCPTNEIDCPIYDQIKVVAPLGNGTMREAIHNEPAQDGSISNLLV